MKRRIRIYAESVFFMAKDLNILTERGKKRKILRNVNGRDLIKPTKGIQIENVSLKLNRR